MKKLNHKGLTLIELMAVIAILAVLAVLVTPNIIGAIKKARGGMSDTQANTILSAARNWTADKLDTEHCLICIPDDTGIKTENACDTSGGEGCIDLAVCYSNDINCPNKETYKNKKINVTLAELKNGYLEEDLKNPKTDAPYRDNSYVEIAFDEETKQYTYTFVGE